MSGFSDINARLQERAQQHLYRRRRTVESAQGRTLTINGHELLNFCSNDYLGLAADPRLRDAMRHGIDRWGVGSGASHLVSGHTAAHHELEEALADFTGRPRCLLFSSGYAANVGTINGLLDKGDHIFEDRLNHASLLDGGWISRAEFSWYRHNDPEHLAQRLANRAESPGRKLVASDGVFSMDGDTCRLNELVDITARHPAWLMIDDAHGFGVIGKEGRGTVDPGLHDSHAVPILVGTLGKAFGTQGAFVAGSEDLIETLIQSARTYIYSTAIPAAVAVATLASLKILRAEEWRREHLRVLTRRFRSGAEQIGLQLVPASDSPIQPVLLGAESRALDWSAALEQQGFLITAIRPPTVPKGTARLRITFTAAHTPVDVDRLLSALATLQATGK